MATIDSVISTLRARNKESLNESLIRNAYEFAKKAHAGQKRRSGDPYITHPLAVAERLAELGLDSKTVAAALLHDVCEDCGISHEQLKEKFGVEINFLVEGVTKVNKLKYQGAEATAENLRKMFLAIAEDIRVVIIKLVDRLHNMKTLSALPPEKQKRIALETLEIYAPLAYRLGIGELKGQLEDLAFPYVYPNEYQWLIKNVKQPFDERKKFVEGLQPLIEAEFKKEKIPFTKISARAKHMYSLYRKLARVEMDISRVFDLVAIRILVPNVESCYAALGLIHKLWRPMPGKIKDYIALPKPNGYQSLHTTVFGPHGNVIEFQIRTNDMHAEAEFGIAAHWAYSEKKSGGSKAYTEKKGTFAEKKELTWVQQLHEWHSPSSSPEEFLESIKIDFFKNRIFALTPKGDVIDLPEGATTIDFAYHIHSDIGDSATGAKVNSRIVPLEHTLVNGDVVEIIIKKNKKPNSDWISFAKTSLARKHIQARLKRADEEQGFSMRGKRNIELRFSARDRIGLLKDISNVMEKFKINMDKVVSNSNNLPLPILVINCQVKDLEQLKKLIRSLKEVKGVRKVDYRYT